MQFSEVFLEEQRQLIVKQLEEVIGLADKYGYDRDDIVNRYFTMMSVFVDITTVRDYKNIVQTTKFEKE